MVKATFRALIPPPLQFGKIRLALLTEGRKMGKQVVETMQVTTYSWEHKVKFNSSVSLAGGHMLISVGTDDEVYLMVSEGTKEHPIVLHEDKNFFALPMVWKAQTTPNSLYSSPRRTIGFRRYSNEERTIYLPGIKPRNFLDIITDMWETQISIQFSALFHRLCYREEFGIDN